MTNLYGTLLITNDFFQKKFLSECPLECYFDQFDEFLSFTELIPNVYMDFLKATPIWAQFLPLIKLRK
jgi:hypothetical protein